MSSSDKYLYRIVVPEEWKDALIDAFHKSALEEGQSLNYQITEGRVKEGESRLKFGLETAAIFVAVVVVEAVISHFVSKGLDYLAKSIQDSRAKQKAEIDTEDRIDVVTPRGTSENFNASNLDESEKAVERIRNEEGVIIERNKKAKEPAIERGKIEE